MCRLEPTDPLPSWLQRSRGIVTRDVLTEYPERMPVLRELDLCGGVIALPLFCEGMLRGIMAIGPKAIGTPYMVNEAEALFVLSANAANAARQTELHRELESRNGYIDQILTTMESGIVTISLDARIRGLQPVRSAGAAAEAGDGHRAGPAGAALAPGRLPVLVPDVRGGAVAGGAVGAGWAGDGSGLHAAPAGASWQLDGQHDAAGGHHRGAHAGGGAAEAGAQRGHQPDRGPVCPPDQGALATIHTFAELFPTRRDDPEFENFWAEYVKRDVHRLDDLVAKLVSLSEQPPSKREMVEIPELLRQAVTRLSLLDDDAPGHIVSRLNDGLPAVQVDTNVMAAALSHLLRYGLGDEHNTVTVEAKLQEGPEGEQPIAIFIRAANISPNGDDPQRLLDPAYVIDHPDIDLGPSASQRLIESQGGALTAYHESGEIVFRVSLIPAHEHAVEGRSERTNDEG